MVVDEIDDEFRGGDGMSIKTGIEWVARTRTKFYDCGIQLNREKIEKLDADIGEVEAKVREYGYKKKKDFKTGPIFVQDV